MGPRPPAGRPWAERNEAAAGLVLAWCSLSTPEIRKVPVKVDPHSPARFRVLGPLRNFDGFARAFPCGAGTAMSPVKRCEVC